MATSVACGTIKQQSDDAANVAKIVDYQDDSIF
jgi:hypothetical protein